MYGLYKEEVENPVSIKIYSQEVEILNLRFKRPSNDPCHTCDMYKNKMENSEERKKKEEVKNN